MQTPINSTPWLPVKVEPDSGSGRSTGTFVQQPRRPKDDWVRSGRWEVIDGRFVITEFTIRRSQGAEEGGKDPSQQAHGVPGKGITSEVLKRTRLGTIVREIRGFLTGYDDYVKARLAATDKAVSAQLESLASQASAVADAASPVPARGRKITLTDDHYRLVAELHLEALSDPNERRTRQRVQEFLRDHGAPVSKRTVALYVSEARRRGFLTAAEKGTSWAEPGPNRGHAAPRYRSSRRSARASRSSV